MRNGFCPSTVWRSPGIHRRFRSSPRFFVPRDGACRRCVGPSCGLCTEPNSSARGMRCRASRAQEMGGGGGAEGVRLFEGYSVLGGSKGNPKEKVFFFFHGYTGDCKMGVHSAIVQWWLHLKCRGHRLQMSARPRIQKNTEHVIT